MHLVDFYEQPCGNCISVTYTLILQCIPWSLLCIFTCLVVLFSAIILFEIFEYLIVSLHFPIILFLKESIVSNHFYESWEKSMKRDAKNLKKVCAGEDDLTSAPGMAGMLLDRIQKTYVRTNENEDKQRVHRKYLFEIAFKFLTILQ